MSEPESHDRDERDGGDSGGRRSTGAAPSLPYSRPPEAKLSLFQIYKPGQGAIVRWGTAAGAGLIALGFAAFLSDQLAWFGETTRVLVPVLALVVLGVLIFRLVGQNRSVVEFLIATEGEMKKVNWSTRKEVIGSTKVVILVILALGFTLFFVDILFMFFFELIGVLRIGMLDQLFGGGK